MAIKIWDGMDHYDLTADFLSRSGFLQYVLPGPNLPTLSFVTGRNGFGKALKLLRPGGAGQSPMRMVWGDRNAEGFVGQAMLIPAGNAGNAASVYLMLRDGVAGDVQLTILFNANNYSVQIWRGDALNGSPTQLYLSANNVWTGDVWNFVEYHAKIANSGGSIAVRINGVVVASVTGADTQNTANAWFDGSDLQVISPSDFHQTTFILLDDVYYADTATGAGAFAANTYLGDVRVATLFPTGDDAVQWTPNSGSNNYSRVNELAMDSDTTFNSSGNAGDQDTFDFQPLVSVAGIIFGVQLTIAARKDDAGARVLKQVMKSGGTTVYGADNSLPDTDYTYFTDQWILDPNTSANWTRTNLNAITPGYKLVS